MVFLKPELEWNARQSDPYTVHSTIQGLTLSNVKSAAKRLGFRDNSMAASGAIVCCAIVEAVLKPWSWLRTALDHGTRQQVTRMGLLFTMTCVLVALAAFVSANNLLFLILALLLGTMLVAGFISRLSLAGLELDFLLPEHLCAGRKLMGRIVIRNSKNWMPSFSIHLVGSSDSGLELP